MSCSYAQFRNVKLSDTRRRIGFPLCISGKFILTLCVFA